MPGQSINSEAKNLETMAIDLSERGQIDDAIKCFQKAIELEPEDGMLRFNLALTYMKDSNLDGAIQELKETIKFEPNYADSYFALATCYMGQGTVAKAALYYLAYLDFSKSNEKAKTSQMRLHEFGSEGKNFPIKVYLDFMKKEYESKLNNIRMLIANQLGGKVTPDIEAKLNNYASEQLEKSFAYRNFINANDFLEKGKSRAAVAHFIEGLAYSPNSQLAICGLAASYAEAGDFDQAEIAVNLVEVNNAGAEEKQVVQDQIKHLKQYIKSHR